MADLNVANSRLRKLARGETLPTKGIGGFRAYSVKLGRRDRLAIQIHQVRGATLHAPGQFMGGNGSFQRGREQSSRLQLIEA